MTAKYFIVAAIPVTVSRRSNCAILDFRFFAGLVRRYYLSPANNCR
jgi:hypothetical protein